MLTRLLVSGILESPPNDRRGLYAHLCRASLVEMEGILVEVRMFRHKSVLVVDGNFFRFDDASGDRISRVNAGIRGAVRCLGFDRRDRSPDKLAATGERPKGLKENGKARFELRFGVAPTVQPVIEVDDGEGDTLHSGELGDLVGKARIAYRGRRRQEVDICYATKILGYLWEIIARDGVAEEKDVGQLGVGNLLTNFPGPLDLFGNRGLVLGPHEYRLRDKTQTENSH